MRDLIARDAHDAVESVVALDDLVCNPSQCTADVVRRHDPAHARGCGHRAQVHAHDTRMRVHGANHVQVQGAGVMNVGGVLALTGDEPVILGTGVGHAGLCAQMMAHAAPPWSCWAACLTAAAMLT